MDEWRKLTEEEKETLLPYFKSRYKPAVIFFTAIKCFGLFQWALGLVYFFQNITSFSSIFNALFFIIGLLVGLCMFYMLPKKLIYFANREVNAIKTDIAQVIETVVIEKDRSSNRSGHKKINKYRIIAQVKGIDNYVYLETDGGSYALLNKEDKCKVMFFPLRESDHIAEDYMLAFDYNLDFIKYTNANK